jgi:hypothetical protein
MRPLLPMLCLLGAACASLWAGEKQSAESGSAWSGSLAQGWDSLYMYRGVNQLPGFAGYGSGISWTALTVGWAPTEADSFTVGSWAAFGLGETDYKEIDLTAGYFRSIGDLSLSVGYALYAVLSAPGGLYCHQLSASAAYELRWGSVVFSPGIGYDFTLGPSPDHGGYVQEGSSYLEARLDVEVPLVAGFLSAEPWIAAGFNFDYNTRETPDGPVPFSGANHLETGVSLSFAVTERIGVAPYVAFSHAWQAFPGTKRNTFWGGAAVTFAF